MSEIPQADYRPRRLGRPPGSRTTVWWNHATLELIRGTTERLIADGMTRPPIRAVLYRLLSLPGWTKSHYGTLCRKLGEWRDEGLLPYGVFGDEAGGRSRPQTAGEIAEQIRAWQETEPARLPADGWLRGFLVEHQALVGQVQDWCDGQALVVSSSGQIKRENLWTAVQEWKQMASELGAKGVHVYALVDRDRGGDNIYEAHRRWFQQLADLDLEFFGISDDQLRRFGLSLDELWQIDGLVALDVGWWQQQIRELLLGREAGS
jgi:hypothetical protein